MHKLSFLIPLRSDQTHVRFVTLCSILFLLTIGAYGQNIKTERPPQTPAIKIATLPDKIGAHWRAIGNSRVLNADQSLVLPDGAIYAEYGLQNLTTRFYTDGKVKVAVELFQTQFPSEAYGLLTFTRSTKRRKDLAFYAGPLLVQVSAESEEDTIDQSFLADLKTVLATEEGELPALPFNLPEQGKIAGTERYVIGPLALAQMKEFEGLKNVVNFSGGTHAVMANYGDANSKLGLIIVEYHTPQLASDGHSQFQNYFNNLTRQEKSSWLLKRIGNYVVAAADVQDIQAAESIIAQVKYSPKVYWEGKKITDLPIQFRPPDPLAIQEASQTASMIVRTFYWIGIMITGAIIIGFITGGSFFYWKRYRRRKLGVDDIFSDAGGTVRLNLDDYLLSPGDSVKNIMEEKKRIEG